MNEQGSDGEGARRKHGHRDTATRGGRAAEAGTTFEIVRNRRGFNTV
jgi:hypothetical protein